MSRDKPPGRHRGRRRLIGRYPSLAPRPGEPGAGTFGWVPGWLAMLPAFALGGAAMYAAGYAVGRLLGGYEAAFGPVWAGGMWVETGLASTVATLRSRARARSGGPADGGASHEL